MSTIKQELLALASEERAIVCRRFFKTGDGEYGEGDIFVGVTIPVLRSLAKRYFKEVSLSQVKELLQDPIHECRMLALLLMVAQYNKGTQEDREAIYQTYITHTDYINNWDLVDLSAHYIVGVHLAKGDKAQLFTFAQSNHLWQQRIAIVATWIYIRKGEFSTTLLLAEILLDNPHNLIHKAVGWMLREVGKKDQNILCQFLDSHAAVMPRVMLSYAVEKFSPEVRAHYRMLR